MYRVPVRHPSPGASRPAGRFPSPAWVFPGARSPSVGPRCGGSLQYRGSPRGSPGCSPASPAAFSNRGCGDSPVGFGSGSRGYGDSPVTYGAGSRGYGDSPAGFGAGSRGYGGSGGKMRRRPDGFRRSYGAPGPQGFQDRSDAVEKYYSPAMLRDPWADLQPVAR